MKHRKLGPFNVSAIGLGCMNLSHAYGAPVSAEQGERVLLTALDQGVDFFDTAALYGFGANETLVGKVLKPHRQKFTLASKCGMQGVDKGDGTKVRVIDGRPETIKKTCEDALRRLQTDVIDLYYLHRWDKQVPIEDSVGALSDLVRKGHIRSIGLSEVSAATLRRAHAALPVTAVQSEYSMLWRGPEADVLPVCGELGIGFVPFSPLGKGFLTGTIDPNTTFGANDFRNVVPRFTSEAREANQVLVNAIKRLAEARHTTPAQIALAWLLAQKPWIVPIPGTTKLHRLEENLAAADVILDADDLHEIDSVLAGIAVQGNRYPTQYAKLAGR